MTSTTPPTARRLAVAIPLLLLSYGVLRLIDGMDGSHGPGVAWNLGHTCFLGAFLLLGLLVVRLRSRVPAASLSRRVATETATGAGLFGAACFVWVILGDLAPALPALPGPLRLVGPLCFQLALLALLTMLAAARHVPARTPALTALAFVLITVDLDLLPAAALALLAAFAPLTHTPAAARPPRVTALTR
ncbi:hypothetical protein [Streptomyces sp. NPDC088785]|uniref:hypothetical protein n=1 Tax=Streptomyces sp. NPDC088785 TaxID=3365897 RepID=UPI003800D62C